MFQLRANDVFYCKFFTKVLANKMQNHQINTASATDDDELDELDQLDDDESRIPLFARRR